MAFRAPLLGYNTNVRHKGKLYHIQTEDSGIDHPHVITHLFADGGRILASKKTSYAERVGDEGLQDTVKKLMQAQHKAMFIALRDGLYDEEPPSSEEPLDRTGTRALPPVPEKLAAIEPSLPAHAAPPSPPAPPAAVLPPAPALPSPPPKAVEPRSLFGGDLLTDRSLDEVILNYLAANENES